MTNDKQVEVCRDEFESMMREIYPLHSLKRLPDDSAYIERDVFYIEQGFLMAKRSMQQIELPSGHGMTISYREGISDAKDAITEAGYSYRVRS